MDDPKEKEHISFIQKHKTHIIYILLFTIITISIYCSVPTSNNIIQVGGVAPLIAAEGISRMGGMGGMDLNGMKGNLKDVIHNSEKPKTASALASPISSTFGFVTSVIGKILKLIFLFFVIILVPTVPFVLYAIAAYFMIRKFLGFFSS